MTAYDLAATGLVCLTVVVCAVLALRHAEALGLSRPQAEELRAMLAAGQRDVVDLRARLVELANRVR